MCLQSPSEFLRKSGQSHRPRSGIDARDDRPVGTGLEPRRRVAYRPSTLPFSGRRLDPQLVLAGRLQPPQEGVHGLDPHRPFLGGHGLQHVARQDLGRDLGGVPPHPGHQRLEGLGLFDRNDAIHVCSSIMV